MTDPRASPIVGTFSHPLIGIARAPAGVTGEGHLRPTPEGLEIVGRVSPTGLISLFGGLGFLVGFVLAGLFASAIREMGGGLPLVIVFGPMIAGLVLGKKMGKERPLAVTIPWAKIRKATLQGNQLSFLLEQKPKGMVYFSSPNAGGLGAILAAIRSGTGA